MAFIDRLWDEWSPGYDAGEDLALVKRCLADRPNLSAAIEYYRAALGRPAESCGKFEAEQRALALTPPQPTLYLHGARDGCIGVDLVTEAEASLSPGSRFSIVEDGPLPPPREARMGQRGDPGLGLTSAGMAMKRITDEDGSSATGTA